MIERLEMITCGGAEKSIFEIDFDQGEHTRDGFRERRGVLVHGGGQQVVQRIAYTDQARRELGRAVKTADGLVRRLGVTGYPPELSRIIGHRPDTRAPFLLTTRRGRPLAELRGELPLPPGELWDAIDGIVAVLTQLHELRLVHRDISPQTLLWDGSAIQLADFGLALHEGENRGDPVGADPWRCPEQAAGLGKADCRDDVYAAGAVIFLLATGEEAGPTPDMRDRVGYLDRSLRTLLDGVFTDQAHTRVSGYALRRRREGHGGPTRGPGRGANSAPPRLAELEQQARDNFRTLRAQQQAFRRQPPRMPFVPPPQPPGTGPTSRIPPVVWLVAFVAAVVLIAVTLA